jgi:Spy/CpxP family protein refolding chaperone
MSAKSLFVLIAFTALVGLTAADMVMAQPGGGRGGRGMMRMLGGNNQYALLADSRVQEELELVDEQIRELEQIQQEVMQTMRDMFSEMQDQGGGRDAFRNVREKIQERMKPFESRFKEVLLPHQMDRLKQLSYQSAGRGQGAGGALSNEALLDELEVTEEQREELQKAMEEARDKIQKELVKLQRDAEENILKVLDAEQRKKYRELVGESFQFDNRAGFRGRGTDRGNNRGGNRRDR